MDKSSILSLRRTSKDWKRICDSYVESNVSGNYSTKKKYLLLYRRWNDLSDCLKLFFLKKVFANISYLDEGEYGNVIREEKHKRILKGLEEEYVQKLQKKYLRGKILGNVYNDIAHIQNDHVIVQKFTLVYNNRKYVCENVSLSLFFRYYSRNGGWIFMRPVDGILEVEETCAISM